MDLATAREVFWGKTKQSEDPREIKSHYNKRVLELHPDKIKPDNGSDSKAINERFTRFQDAYTYLRFVYTRKRPASTPSTQEAPPAKKRRIRTRADLPERKDQPTCTVKCPIETLARNGVHTFVRECKRLCAECGGDDAPNRRPLCASCSGTGRQHCSNGTGLMDCVVCGGKGRPASTCLTCKGEGLVTQKLKITLPLDGSDAYLIKEAGDDTVTQRSSGIRFRVSEEPHPHFATCEKDLLGYIRAPLSRYYTHGTVAFQHPDGTTKRLSLLRSDGTVIPSGALADYAGLGLPVGPESKDRGHLRVIVEAELPRDKQAAQAEAARVLAGVATETGASEAVTAEHITDPLRFQWHKLNPIPLLS